MSKAKSIEEKRKERKKITAEDFSPEFLVNDIIEKLTFYSYGMSYDNFYFSGISNKEKREITKNSPNHKFIWEENNTFIDPACGNGNFLVEILKRKLDLRHDPLHALNSIFGMDIMADNIRECRIRLLKVIQENKFRITPDMVKIVFMNIAHTPLHKYPNGALDYHMKFNGTIKKQTLDKWVYDAFTGRLFNEEFLEESESSED